MKIDFNRLEDLNARMTLTIEFADYSAKMEENMKKYQKKLNIKGFRTGKTPKSVLSKMYGKGMLEETIHTLLNEKLFSYLEEHKISHFGSPIMAEGADPIDFDVRSGKDYTFVFDLGLKPDFNLQFDLDNALEVAIPQIDQTAIEDDVIRYRRVFGEDVQVEEGTVEAHDKVTITLNKLNADGVAEGEGIERVVDLDRTQGEAKTSLLNLAKGAQRETDLEKFLGQERGFIVKNTLQLEADPHPDAPLMYRITITSIHRPQKTALTGEQLTRFVGKQMEDEAEFRQFLEKRETDAIQSQVNDLKKMLVRLRLVKANPLTIPENFLVRWINQQREKKIERGTREAEHFFKDARWSLLLNRISTDEGLEVTEKDVQKQVTNWIVQNVNYMQTDIRKLMDQLYANEYFMSSMKENALEEVVFTHLLPKYTFTEKPVSMAEFEKIFHDAHHEIFDHGDHHHEHSHEHHEHSHG